MQCHLKMTIFKLKVFENKTDECDILISYTNLNYLIDDSGGKPLILQLINNKKNIMQLIKTYECSNNNNSSILIKKEIMDKFYIDRQFGQAIWIDVEKGIVQNCYNEEPKFVARMNELYVGKSITFLNEDFIGRAMKGTYHHLRAEGITSPLQIVEAWKSKVRNMNGRIANHLRINFRNTEEAEKTLQEYRKLKADYEIEQYKAEKFLEIEKERILTEHNFKS